MIGGIVSAVVEFNDEVRVFVKENEAQEEPYALRLVRNADSVRIKPGDQIWWQLDSAYWTADEDASWLDEFSGRDVRIPRRRLSWEGEPLAPARAQP